jgi:hypothetical protein
MLEADEQMALETQEGTCAARGSDMRVVKFIPLAVLLGIPSLTAILMTTSLSAQTYYGWSGDGQSNCTGAGAYPYITDVQPYQNRGFEPGVIPPAPSGASAVLLTNSNYSSSGQEYPIVSILNELTLLSSGNSYHGVGDTFDCASGAGYNSLKKGTLQYNAWLSSFSPTPAANIATDALSSNYAYAFGGFYNIHGEADFGSAAATVYAGWMDQWLNDQTADVIAGLGLPSNTTFPMLLHQFSGWNVCSGSCSEGNSATPTMPDGVTPSTPIGQWQAAINDPRFILSPGYQFTFNPSLTVHMDSGGIIGMGSLMGKQAADWLANPNRPLFTTPRAAPAPSGTTWAWQFWVPVGHLVFDTTTLAPSPAGCYGFEIRDNAGPISCSSLPTLSGTGSQDGGFDTVNFTLTRSCGAGCTVSYAYTGQPGAQPGTALASHGNLRDTDDRQVWCGGQVGAPSNSCANIPAQDLHLYNWLVAFTTSSFPFSYNPFGSASRVCTPSSVGPNTSTELRSDIDSSGPPWRRYCKPDEQSVGIDCGRGYDCRSASSNGDFHAHTGSFTSNEIAPLNATRNIRIP